MKTTALLLIMTFQAGAPTVKVYKPYSDAQCEYLGKAYGIDKYGCVMCYHKFNKNKTYRNCK